MRCLFFAIVGLAFISSLGFSQEIEKPAAQVEYHRQRQNGWKVADSTNFRLFYLDDFNRPEQVLVMAEKTRVTVSKKWLDMGAEPHWDDRCRIVIYATAESYGWATGVAKESPGHSQIELNGSRVVSLCVNLRADFTNMESAVLPHEVTHVTIAGQFGAKSIPRWADEGIAVLSEPEVVVNRHLGNLAGFYKDGRYFKAGDLMGLADYPHPQLVEPFYGQSISLVQYLTNLKDARTFGKFLKQSQEKGYDEALKLHYGIDGTEALDRAWRKHIDRRKKTD